MFEAGVADLRSFVSVKNGRLCTKRELPVLYARYLTSDCKAPRMDYDVAAEVA